MQASLPTLYVKVNELESKMSSDLSLTPQFEAWSSRLGAVDGDVIGFDSRLESIDNTPLPPPLPSKDWASSTAFDSLHTRVSALEYRLNPLHDFLFAVQFSFTCIAIFNGESQGSLYLINGAIVTREVQNW